MGGAGRVTRRRALVTVLVLVGIADAILAAAFLSIGGQTRAEAALPLHPVVGSFVPDETTLQECSDERCFQQALGNVAYYRGPEAAFSLVPRVYGDGASSACHRASHFIGAAALVRYGEDVTRTFAAGSAACWSGYYHGVLERSLVNVESYEPAALAAAARPLCREISARTTPWIAYQCLHGLGHGLMVSTGLSLPLALDVCKRLDSRWDRDACKGGVFMENIQASFGFRSPWLRDDDPVYPCNAVARADKFRCYQMVTSRILPAVDGDWERTAQACSEVESDFVSVCFLSFGRDASNRTDRNAAETARVCAIARPYRGEADCVVGAAMDVVSNYMSGERATPLCEEVGARPRERCFYGIGATMGRFRTTPEARVADCRSVASAPVYVAACLEGGRSTLPRR